MAAECHCQLRSLSDNALSLEKFIKKVIPCQFKDVMIKRSINTTSNDWLEHAILEPIRLELPIDTDEVLAAYEDLQKEIQDETDSEED